MRLALVLLAASVLLLAAAPIAPAAPLPGACSGIPDPALHNLCANACEVANNTPPPHPRVPCG